MTKPHRPTRKELVLAALTQAKTHGHINVGGRLVATADGWVDHPLLLGTIGGTEGLRRLRELREDGHTIEMRKHPDPARDGTNQYRLVDSATTPAASSLF